MTSKSFAVVGLPARPASPAGTRFDKATLDVKIDAVATSEASRRVMSNQISRRSVATLPGRLARPAGGLAILRVEKDSLDQKFDDFTTTSTSRRTFSTSIFVFRVATRHRTIRCGQAGLPGRQVGWQHAASRRLRSTKNRCSCNIEAVEKAKPAGLASKPDVFDWTNFSIYLDDEVSV